MKLEQLLQLVIEKNASDLHLIPGYFPTIRVGVEIYSLTTLSVISPDLNQEMVFSILTDEQKENLQTNWEIDFAYSYYNNRFRINAYFAQGVICASFRLIIAKIRTLEELLIPAFIREVVDYRQ